MAAPPTRRTAAHVRRGFHVHGPHDHELERAHKGGHGDHGAHEPSSGTIAVVTAVLATVALLTKKRWLEWGMFGVAAALHR